jgi:epoxyqueuosine reductase
MSDPHVRHTQNAATADWQVGRSVTRSLKKHLGTLGADLVGIGSVERLRGAPEIMQPSRYLRDAASLISIALRVNEAACDLIAESVRGGAVPASYHSYQTFTLKIVNPQLDRLAYLGAKFLEQRGYRAYPFPANLPHVLKPSAEYAGGPGDISHKHVAVACGLGRIGWHTLLITPQFGTRQKLVSIVTNAPLEPDPMCEVELCDPCRCGFQCARACPTAAIPTTLGRTIRIDIGGMPVEYAAIVGWRCRWGCSGMLKCTGGYKDIALPEAEPTAEQLLSYKAEVDPWQKRLRDLSGLIPYCGRCLCICPKPSPAFVEKAR